MNRRSRRSLGSAAMTMMSLMSSPGRHRRGHGRGRPCPRQRMRAPRAAGDLESAENRSRSGASSGGRSGPGARLGDRRRQARLFFLGVSCDPHPTFPPRRTGMRETTRLLPRLKKLLGSITCSLALTAAAAGTAAAQPFDAWFSASPSATGFIEVPHAAALNPAGAFTFEAWVAISNSARRRRLPQHRGQELHPGLVGRPVQRRRPAHSALVSQGRGLTAQWRHHSARRMDPRCGGVQRHQPSALHQRRARGELPGDRPAAGQQLRDADRQRRLVRAHAPTAHRRSAALERGAQHRPDPGQPERAGHHAPSRG